MDIKELIESGKLELYVYGQLDASEAEAITKLAANNPELMAEIVSIENSMLNLSSSFSPPISSVVYDDLKRKMSDEIPSNTDNSKSNLGKHIGWIMAGIMGLGSLFLIFNKNECAEKNNFLINENKQLKDSIDNIQKTKTDYQRAYAIINDANYAKITLQGQKIAPNSVATVYWNKKSKEIYVDVSALPVPTAGKVYQVWSLTLDPLTPTSIGTLDNLQSDSLAFFKLGNTDVAQAFGITLEPKGGSKSPTMEQLYTLGKI